MIEINHVNKWYGPAFQVLKDCTTSVAKGEVVVVCGPSGSGKSTLIKCVNALEPIQGGDITLDGVKVNDPKTDLPKLRSRVGMVFQKPTPFPMSIYDNVAFGVRLYESKSKSEMDGIVEGALRKAALWEEVKDKLKASGLSLSGGQQQRLCVARGIAVEPEILLLDEPASALDPISTAKLEETIGELKSDYTIVIVTHNLSQAARISDYTGFMYLGKMIEFGPTDEIFMRPKVGRTQDYVCGRFG